MKLRTAILLSTFFLIPAISGAETHWGFNIPPQRDGLNLVGAGVLRKGLFFKIYAGALYVQPAEDGNADLAQYSKRIDIYYFHDIPKKYMIGAAHKSLKKNLSETEYGRLLPAINELHDAFLDGKKDSMASVVHESGKGLSYVFDNNLRCFIPGDDFANAYFSIWLGSHPSSRSMKEAMLKGWTP